MNNTTEIRNYATCHPDMFQHASCLLCGATGENVVWYSMWSPESDRTMIRLAAALHPGESILSPAVDWLEEVARVVDPIAAEFGWDYDPVCNDCATATRPELRARIRRHADTYDEAAYQQFGPTAEYDELADSAMRDRGIWIRRHVGMELRFHREDIASCSECGR